VAGLTARPLPPQRSVIGGSVGRNQPPNKGGRTAPSPWQPGHSRASTKQRPAGIGRPTSLTASCSAGIFGMNWCVVPQCAAGTTSTDDVRATEWREQCSGEFFLSALTAHVGPYPAAEAPQNGPEKRDQARSNEIGGSEQDAAECYTPFAARWLRHNQTGAPVAQQDRAAVS
jgi:hypothetical protein